MDEIIAVRAFRSEIPDRDAGARDAVRRTLEAALAEPLRAPRRSLWRSRRMWVLIAVTLGAVAAVSSAFGWTSRLIDVIAGQPAPPRIKRTFALENEARERVLPIFRRQAMSDTIIEQAHGVIGFDSSVGPVILWAAPTRGGGLCWLIEIKRADELAGRPTSNPNCSPQLRRVDAPLAYGFSRTLVGDRYLALIEGRLQGRLQANVTSLELRYGDGRSEMVPIAEGFFLQELRVESEPILLIARDRSGAEVKRLEVQAFELIPPPGPVGPERILIRVETDAGFPLTFSLARTENGELCQLTHYPGGGLGRTCGPDPRTRVAPDEISVHPGLWNEAQDGKPLVTLGGVVGSAIARLDLHYEDGTIVAVPVVEQFVLFVIPPEHRSDERFILVGRSPSGEAITRRVLK